MTVDLSLPEPPARKDGKLLAVITLLGVLAVLVVVLQRGDGPEAAGEDAPLLGRDLAETLERRTLHREAAALWEDLARTEPDPAVALYRAGRSRMLAGDAERALRDFHAAESFGLDEDLQAEANRHVLECYAVLGKFGIRNAELRRRTGSDEAEAGDVVARLGEEEIRREELEQAIRNEEMMRLAGEGRLDREALDEAVAARLADPARDVPTLRRLLSQRALALEALSRDFEEKPEVRRRLASLRRELLGNLLLQERLLEGVTVSDADLGDHYEAHRDRYREPEAARFSWAPVADSAPGVFVEVSDWHVAGAAYPDGRGPSAEADAALFALGPGEITAKPVPLGGEAVFLRLDEKREARTIPFEEARERVRQDLSSRRRGEAVSRLQAEVAQRHPAEIVDEELRKAFKKAGDPAGK